MLPAAHVIRSAALMNNNTNAEAVQIAVLEWSFLYRRYTMHGFVEASLAIAQNKISS